MAVLIPGRLVLLLPTVRAPILALFLGLRGRRSPSPCALRLPVRLVSRAWSAWWLGTLAGAGCWAGVHIGSLYRAARCLVGVVVEPQGRDILRR